MRVKSRRRLLVKTAFKVGSRALLTRRTLQQEERSRGAASSSDLTLTGVCPNSLEGSDGVTLDDGLPRYSD